MLRTMFLVALVLGGPAIWAEESPSSVTFNKDVLPILQRHCQTCHRPGQIAPMSLLSYQETRPWAPAMKAAVESRKMPPWFADSRVGHFLNDRSLKPSEIETIAKWADTGAAEGDAKDMPAPMQWPEGWQIKPDIIVQGPSTEVPAHVPHDVIEWISVTIPSGFQEDTWITSVQIKPEYPEVAHHICLGFNPPRPDVRYFEPVWLNKERDEEGAAIPGKGRTFGPATPGGRPTSMAEDCYLPGNVVSDYRPFQAAKLVRAGWDITMNLHYTPHGKAVTDHVQIGFTVAKEPPQRRYVSLAVSAPRDPERFAIPPHDGNWPSPPAEVAFNQDAELVFLLPHMHLRGKDSTYTLLYPDGRQEILLRVPRYDFMWQLGYHTSVKVPKGAKLRVDAHFDNSANNKFNPNPNRTVYYGEMTWEEMMTGFFGLVVDRSVDPRKVISITSGVAGAALPQGE